MIADIQARSTTRQPAGLAVFGPPTINVSVVLSIALHTALTSVVTALVRLRVLARASVVGVVGAVRCAGELLASGAFVALSSRQCRPRPPQ
ncbi:hypothetical protein [Curtobacterium sp. MCBD17_032]|uniref:hypothetical protein n=1 Tax=Curtobacterium sp. MCBD17_032 TaxID=2175659 RepID=UPI000DA9358C|nr:hypothetical protein [Curtobacterium sp. MCBD17_032]PZE80645.1 hypothetical protein DEI91_13990 [Curtobacterium sp. MCBD17_032]